MGRRTARLQLTGFASPGSTSSQPPSSRRFTTDAVPRPSCAVRRRRGAPVRRLRDAQSRFACRRPRRRWRACRKLKPRWSQSAASCAMKRPATWRSLTAGSSRDTSTLLLQDRLRRAGVGINPAEFILRTILSALVGAGPRRLPPSRVPGHQHRRRRRPRRRSPDPVALAATTS